MRFIDLFAGLGGFHAGVTKAGNHECVFASEIDENLQKLYMKNYGIQPYGDIREIEASEIPKHELLCAGFPCQPFSIAGKKNGSKCPKSGELINDIFRIISYHKPKLVILENVPNLLKIDRGKFWSYIEEAFRLRGYKLTYKIISPIEFGIPQNRKRLFAIGFHDSKDIEKFEWPEGKGFSPPMLDDFLDNRYTHKTLEPKKKLQLKHWQELLNYLGNDNLRSASILAPEFGATYPQNFENITLKEMKEYKGAYGKSLEACESWNEILPLLPSYTRKFKKVPDWLTNASDYSRSIHSQHKKHIDKWKINLDKKNNSWQALEWRGYSDNVDLKNHLIQFRPSGIRISKKNIAPSLTSMTPTQIPIIGSNMRYLSAPEAAKLQHLHTLAEIPKKTNEAFQALGNAVNAKIVELIACNIN